MASMDHEIKKRWLSALQSGKYEHCGGGYHFGKRHCVLGVLIDIYTKETGKKWNPDDAFTWAGLPLGDPKLGSLTAENDVSDDYDAAIKFIERRL